MDAEKNWPRTIGIVGGMGPHAHIAFERYLLEAVGAVAGDQDYPPWIVSSLPRDSRPHGSGQGR